MPLAPAKSLRILVVDGGGIKGFTALLILQRIFRTLKDVASIDEPRPCEVFDLIVGTSTGGLIAVMLGRLGMTIDEAIAQYQLVGRRVFGKPLIGGKAGFAVKGLLGGAAYDIGILQSCIKDALASKEPPIPTDTQFCQDSSLQCKIMLCVTRQITAKPDALRSYKSKQSTQENYDCQIWEAASATSATPIYFKRVKFSKTGEKWVDGGLKRNNPIFEAVAEVQNEPAFKDYEIGCIVSIGTGVPDISGVPSHVLGLLAKAVSMMTDSEEIADNFAKGETGQRLAKANAYFRFNVPQGMQQLKMDDWKETEKMRALTTDYLSKVGSGREVERCAASLLNPDQNTSLALNQESSLLRSYPVQHFVDRETYRSRLHIFFDLEKSTEHERRAFVLWGMSGAGKTQIALKFAHDSNKYTRVFWVRAESRASFINDYAQVFGILNPNMKKAAVILDQGELLVETRKALENAAAQWLLVLDNADDLDSFVHSAKNPHGFDIYLPRTGSILVTTRDRRFQGNFVPAKNGVEVKPMSDTEARDLVLKSLPSYLTRDLQHEDVDELLSDLGNLPLAIAQAVRNMADFQMGLKQYGDDFREARRKMQYLQSEALDLQTDDPRNRTQSVCVNWELSFAYLKKNHPLSATLLAYLATFHWRGVPKYLLSLLPEFKDLSKLELLDVIKHLLHRALINDLDVQILGSEYDLHPLLHQWLVESLQGDQLSYYVDNTLNVVAFTFPLDRPREVALSEERLLGRYLLPHALHLMGLVREVGIASPVFCRLLQAVAQWFHQGKETHFAVDLASEALDVSMSMYETTNWNVFIFRQTLIDCLEANKQYLEAATLGGVQLALMENPDLVAQFEPSHYSNERLVVYERLTRCLYKSGDAKRYNAFIQDAVKNFDSQQNLCAIAWLHNQANLLRRSENESSVAAGQYLNDICIEHARSRGFKNMSLEEQRLYIYMINVRAHIGLWRRIRQQSQTAILDMLLYWLSFSISKEIFGLADIDTWKAANLAHEKTAQSKDHTIQLLKSHHNFIRQATSFELDFDQEFRVTFGYTYAYVFDLKTVPILQRIRKAANMVDKMLDCLLICLSRHGLDIESVLESSLNLYGVALQHIGRFEEAEKRHRQALELDPDRIFLHNRDTWNILQYNTMLAISRQSGRMKEAKQYREQELESIQEAERIYGNFDKRVRDFDEDRRIYDQAKEMNSAGNLSFKDDWWNEHEKALERAELRYGMLYFLDDSYFDNVEPFQEDEELAKLREEFFGTEPLTAVPAD